MRFKVGEHPVPGYRLEAFLGSGSYGEVWKAIGPGGVPCALKFIGMDSKSGLKEFRAIGLVKRLQHPNLCPVQAIWLRDDEGNVLSDTDQNSISIRMLGPKELIIAMGLGQKTLAHVLDETRDLGGVPPGKLFRYMADAAKGIDYLNAPEHELETGRSSIIHCDIKPANLLIVGGGVQVCDYGVAKALGPGMKKTLAAGTPAYAAPELINNEPCAQTDQYSLAIAYYELRTGRLPFDEDKAIVANLTGQLDFSLVPDDEQDALRQATSRRPDARFESCEDMVEALKAASGVSVSKTDTTKRSDMYRKPYQDPDDPGGPRDTPRAGRSTPIQPGLPPDPRATPAQPPGPKSTPRLDPFARGSVARPSPLPPPVEGGTVRFDDSLSPEVVLKPEPKNPWAEPPKGPKAPQPVVDDWSSGTGTFADDRGSKKGGAIAALAVGLVLVLGLVAAGVYMFVIAPKGTGGTAGTGTETSKTEPTKNPEPNAAALLAEGNDLITKKRFAEAIAKADELNKIAGQQAAAKDLRGRAEDAERLHMIATLKEDITRAIADMDYKEAKEKLSLLRLRDPDAAATFQAQIDKLTAPTNAGLDAAARPFNDWKTPGQLKAGFDALDRLLADQSLDAATRKRAQELKKAWEQAKASEDAAKAKMRLDEFRKKFGPPSSDYGSALTEFSARQLALVIEAEIPRLGKPTDWKAVAEACAAAEKTPAVVACLAECWSEDLALAPTGAEYRPAAVAGLDGYAAYVAAVLTKRRGKASPADTATALVAEVPAKPLPAWVNDRRAGVIVTETCAATADPVDTPLAEPYPAAKAADVYAWQTLGDAAATAAKADAGRHLTIRYQLLLAGWAGGAKDKTQLAPLADAVAADLAKLKLKPAQEARFHVAFGSTRAAAADEAAAYAKAAKVADAPADFLMKAVVSRVNAPTFVAAFKQKTPAAETATDLYHALGKHVLTHREAWVAVGAPPATTGADLFEKAVQLSGRDEDKAWRGLCRAEGEGANSLELKDEADALTATGAPVVPAFQAVAAHLKGFQSADKAKGVTEAARAPALFEAALKAAGPDHKAELSVLRKWVPVNGAWLVGTLSGRPEKAVEIKGDLAGEARLWLARAEKANALFGKPDDPKAADKAFEAAWAETGRVKALTEPVAREFTDYVLRDATRLARAGKPGEARDRAKATVLGGTDVTADGGPLSEVWRTWVKTNRLLVSRSDPKKDHPTLESFANVTAVPDVAGPHDYAPAVRLRSLRALAALEVVKTDPFVKGVLSSLGEGQRAVDLIKAPGAPELPKEVVAEAHGAHGLALLEAKMPAEARKALTLAVTQDPTNDLAFMWQYALAGAILKDALGRAANVPDEVLLGVSLALEARLGAKAAAGFDAKAAAAEFLPLYEEVLIKRSLKVVAEELNAKVVKRATDLFALADKVSAGAPVSAGEAAAAAKAAAEYAKDRAPELGPALARLAERVQAAAK